MRCLSKNVNYQVARQDLNLVTKVNAILQEHKHASKVLQSKLTKPKVRKNKGGTMMRRFILTFIVLLTLSTTVYAGSLTWSDWKVTSVTGSTLKSGDANNRLTTGVFIGPVAEWKNASGKSIVGFGGVVASLEVTPEGNLRGVGGLTPLTLLDNMVQVSVVGDINDFSLSNPDSYMLFISADVIKFGKWLGMKSVSTLEALTP